MTCNRKCESEQPFPDLTPEQEAEVRRWLPVVTRRASKAASRARDRRLAGDEAAYVSAAMVAVCRVIVSRSGQVDRNHCGEAIRLAFKIVQRKERREYRRLGWKFGSLPEPDDDAGPAEAAAESLDHLLDGLPYRDEVAGVITGDVPPARSADGLRWRRTVCPQVRKALAAVYPEAAGRKPA